MCTMGSTQVMCETYCEAYGDYLYCISGAISWTQCLNGGFDSPPTYGSPYFSPPSFVDDYSDSAIHKNNTSLIAGAVAGGIAGTAIFFLIALLLYCYCRRLHPKPLGVKSMKRSRDGASTKELTSTTNSKALSIRHLESLTSEEMMPTTHGPASVVPETTPLKIARAVALAEVRSATCTTNYSRKHLIGEGRFGSVYYGRLATGEEVAVKVNTYKGHQCFKSFHSEVSILSGLHHPNVVSLVGYCDEDHNRMLIFEFMHKKTLRHHLYGLGLKEPLDWKTRLEVSASAARGLQYLHDYCNPPIVHGDIKTSNILLDDKFVAKIADLDLSKLLPESSSPRLDDREYYPSYIPVNANSRLPYDDPEWASDLSREGRKPKTQKSDVYSFGVVLLEIICSRPPRDAANDYTIVTWAREIMKSGKVEALVDPTLAGTYNIDVLWKVAELAMTCVEHLAVHRPEMRQVVLALMEAIELQNVAGPDKVAVLVKSEENNAPTPPSSDSNSEQQKPSDPDVTPPQ